MPVVRGFSSTQALSHRGVFVYYSYPVQTDLLISMNTTIPDPIRHAAKLVSPSAPEVLERRIKLDVFNSIGRIKPTATADVDFDLDVMSGTFFESLPPPLQGIAIARTEGVMAFYNRVGWNPAFLDTGLDDCVPEAALDTLTQRYHAKTLHDLAYVHPKHFVKMLGKADAAALWETLKRFAKQTPA